MLWTNKYIPKNINDIVGNDPIKNYVQAMLNKKILYNLIIYGNHGVGKKTLVNLICKEYFSYKYYHKWCYFIYGSLSGKDISINSITNFIKDHSTIPSSGKYKIIIIYDYNLLSDEIHQSINRLTEIYEKSVRFIMVSNDISCYSESLQSRFNILLLQSLSNDEIIKYIRKITNNELESSIYKVISIISNGDLRKAINYAQIICNSDNKTVDTFYKIFNIPSIQKIIELIKLCYNKKCNEAINIITELIDNGYNSNDICEFIIRTLCNWDELNIESNTNTIPEQIISKYIKIYSNYITKFFTTHNDFSISNIHIYNIIFKFIQL